MADEKTPLDQALEALVFAPVGLALTAVEEFPRLVEKGRERITGQVTMARMIGQFVVTQGQKEAERRIKDVMDTFGPSAPSAPSAPSSAASATPATATAPTAPSSNGAFASNGAAPKAARTTVKAVPTTNKGPRRSSAGLAIPGYDTLSASQVVQRLAGLSADELEAVREYEDATRGRRTILSKVAQLQSGAAG